MNFYNIDCIIIQNATGGIFMFTHAIVKKPCHTMIYGITTANLGQPDYDLAMKQHAAYIDALQQCGVQVTILEA